MNKKKTPIRRCIITRESLPKKELIRIVVNKNNEVFIDESKKANGRGYYIKNDLDVITKVVKNKILEKILKIEISEEVYSKLKDIK